MLRPIGALAIVRIGAQFLLLATVIPLRLFAIGDCIAPSSLCRRLEPDMVVFIGRPVSRTSERYGAVTVNFDIQELLWGPPALRSIRVLLDDGYGNKPSQPEFFAVKPLQDGRYVEDNCVGLTLPVTHPFVAEFRRAVVAHRPASISVKAQWHWHLAVSGTEVQLSGNGGTFQGSINDDAGWKIAAVPPGRYKVIATRPNFRQTAPMAEASILPASCADLRILMEHYSEVTGRVVDARGEPIRNATFHLSGEGRSLSQNRFSIASLRDGLFRRFGWIKRGGSEYPLRNHTRTDGNGRFVFRDVYPGWYYLSSDISERNENFEISLPNTYYPGVYGWLAAKHLVVEEGRSIHDVLFRLPDFGPKRRVVIKVSSEDGVPVSGAIVQDSGLDPANQVATNSGAHNTTDVTGKVVLSLWPVAAYRFRATLWGPRQSWSGDPLPIEAGQGDVEQTIVLKGLRLKHSQ